MSFVASIRRAARRLLPESVDRAENPSTLIDGLDLEAPILLIRAPTWRNGSRYLEAALSGKTIRYKDH